MNKFIKFAIVAIIVALVLNNPDSREIALNELSMFVAAIIFCMIGIFAAVCCIIAAACCIAAMPIILAASTLMFGANMARGAFMSVWH